MKSPNLFRTDYPTAPSLPCVFWLWSTITWSFNVIIVWNVSIFSPSYKQLREILAAVWDVLWGLSFVSLTCNKTISCCSGEIFGEQKMFHGTVTWLKNWGGNPSCLAVRLLLVLESGHQWLLDISRTFRDFLCCVCDCHLQLLIFLLFWTGRWLT